MTTNQKFPFYTEERTDIKIIVLQMTTVLATDVSDTKTNARQLALSGRARCMSYRQFAEAPKERIRTLKKTLKPISQYPICKIKPNCDKKTAIRITNQSVRHY